VAIGPKGLDPVAANKIEACQLKRVRREGFLRPFVQLAHDVLFPLATGARAGAAQSLQRNEILRAILPFDGQLRSNLLQIQKKHDDN
jgi:hypothetical protein